MTIAGWDGSGGAGVQADIKTISALGCYATSVLTALPVQNTCGVRSIHSIPVEVVAEQMRVVLDDIPPAAIKIGMVHSVALVETIVSVLAEYGAAGTDSGRRIVFDPVMVATSGDKLIENETVATIVERLFPLADIITPNLDEAEVLTGMRIASVDDMYRAGEKIMTLGCRSLLLKGGHLPSPRLTSLFFAPDGSVTEHHSEKYDTRNTHGSGCTLSSAVASYLARGEALGDAVRMAQDWVGCAILHAADVRTGRGNGPLNHFWAPEKMIKTEE
jgi:hydroxymethylpyrimidine/phosphomethylpyrimidine kinase